ncbi:MAG: diguanylate cyclase [Ilumatobacteraceae bacterium]
MSPTPWRSAIGLVATWAIVVTAGGGHALDASALVLTLGAVLAAASAASRARRAHAARPSLLLLSGAALTWAAGETVHLVARATGAGQSGEGPLAGPVFVVAYLLAIAGFVFIPTEAAGARRVRNLLDVATILTSVLVTVVATQRHWSYEHGGSHPSWSTILQPVLVVLAVGVGAERLGRVRGRMRRPLAWCLAGITAMAAGEVLTSALATSSIDRGGRLVDLAFLIGWILVAIGTVTPVEVVDTRSPVSDIAWVAMATSSVAFVVLCWLELHDGGVSSDRGILILSLLCVAMILVRGIVFQIESVTLTREVRAQASAAEEQVDRYEEALEATGAGIWEIDVAGDHIRMSRSLAALLGRPDSGPQDLDAFLASLSEASRSEVVDGLHAAAESSSPVEISASRLVGDEPITIEARGRALRSADGRVQSLSGVAIDVTTRRRADEQLREQARRSAELADFGRRTLAAGGVDAVVWDALDVIADVVGSDSCRVVRRDPVGDRLRPLAALGSDAPDLSDDGPIRRCVATSSTVLSRADGSSDVVRAVVPIVAQAGVWGVIDLSPGHATMLSESDSRFVEAIAALIAAAADLDAAKTQLSHHALHDDLTGLPNRSLIIDRVSQLLAATRHDGRMVVAFHVGLDRFSQINDSIGHRAGDEGLVEIGRRLAAMCLAGGSVARMSGDEFVLVLAPATPN